MFFKLFAIGFMMDSRTIRQFKTVFSPQTATYSTLLMDPVPSDEGRDFLNNIAGKEGIRSLKALLEKKEAAKNQSFFKSGRDERYDILYNETKANEMIFNITQFTYQMKLLKQLESDQVGKEDKLAAIAEYKRDTEDGGYVANLKKGGLWKDWSDQAGPNH
jgi:hypothetical protein